MRFSRASVLDEIDKKIAFLERDHGFQSGWGYARVEHTTTACKVEFGKYQALLDLREEFEI